MQNNFLGVSDPYLKCLHGQNKLFQTKPIPKTINPTWDEMFDMHIDNPFKPIILQVINELSNINSLYTL